jgi:hypothetical protein
VFGLFHASHQLRIRQNQLCYWSFVQIFEIDPGHDRKRNLPQEETNKLTKEIFEADPVGLLVSALMVSFMDEQ